ncbi:hypothetical protein PHMEG_00032361 [Phytophthora megakarya]|uniref:Uncharacterized protein n=1 Tax=Phytophthora megakarya TaxID=4795 RepID=A0A225UVS0_9STRA|nr:hypothetical protein PHMEG_00032361 [Phytophthora megakarya]
MRWKTEAEGVCSISGSLRTSVSCLKATRRCCCQHKTLSYSQSPLGEVADRFSKAITYNLEMTGLLADIKGATKYDFVFNMDQKSIYIDMGPKRTIEFVGAKNVDALQGMSESSFCASVFLCASATGEKLIPFVVFAGTRDGQVHQELIANRNYREGAILTVQKKAYCDEVRMLV